MTENIGTVNSTYFRISRWCVVDGGVGGHDRRWNQESRVQHGSSTGIKGLVSVTINYEM
jgi:hypothetical protein